jgi:hypothetical protein
MKNAPNALKPGALNLTMLVLSSLLSLFLLPLQVNAQTNPPPATATRPGAPEQTSVPNQAPPASRTQITGEDSHDPTIKKMNEDEKRKVDKAGK